MRKAFFAAAFVLLTTVASAYEPCGVDLRSMSAASGVPGSEFVLYGKWGAAQDKKIPVINRGGPNRLEVLSWAPGEVRVRVPGELKPGKYRVGVYCNELSEGGSYSSGFKDFEVVGDGEATEELDEDADFAGEAQPVPSAQAGPADSRHGETLAPLISSGSFRSPLLIALAVVAIALRLFFKKGEI